MNHPAFVRRVLALVLTAAVAVAAALPGFAVYAMPIQTAYPQESIYLFDADTFEEWETGLPETDPLGFPDYDSLLSGMRKKSDREEAVRCGKAKIANIEVALCIMETTFMMGSMGSVVGEKITRTIERATALGLPLLIFRRRFPL